MRMQVSDQLSAAVDGPYASVICKMLAKEFPRPTVKPNANLLDVLTDEILGTKQTRFGPKPPVENVVSIREVIRVYTGSGRPIPFLVPWGSEKPVGAQIDAAELYGIRSLDSLHRGISQYYSPGAEFRLRIEDASAPHLFEHDPDGARENARIYTQSLVKLIDVLDLDSHIIAVPESLLVREDVFTAKANGFVPTLAKAIEMKLAGKTDEDIASVLTTIGWKGGIAHDTLEYYFTQYFKLYPSLNRWGQITTLARYWAGSLARYQLGTRGDDEAWNNVFLGLSFNPPVPGTAAFANRVVNYRTMPLEYTSNHIAPGRAKGYFTIDNDNAICPKLASWNEPREYESNLVTLQSGDESVNVQMDYVLK